MSLTLDISPELESMLRERARLSGKQLELIVLEALTERLATPEPSDEVAALPRDEWHRRFRDLVAGMPAGNVKADLTRASAYEGRGE